MNTIDLCTMIKGGLSPLFECTPAPREGVRVRTPMMYPDGGIVDVFVLDRGGSYTLTDFGDTLGWLRMQTVNPRRTSKQLQLIEDVCQTLGVELYQGQLVLRECAAHELSETVIRLAQAAVRVSDLWFTLRPHSVKSAAEEVREWLVERHINFDANVGHRGRSGREWAIDFQTYSNGHVYSERIALVFLLSTHSRGAVRRITDHVVAACHDLGQLRIREHRPAFVSLFNDRVDVWQKEDFHLVSQLSEVAMWSRPDELELILREK